MQRITPTVREDQHKWLKKRKENERINTEQSVREALDLLIAKESRANKKNPIPKYKTQIQAN